MTALITALEEAGVGSRELDVAIYKSIRPFPAVKLSAAAQWEADQRNAPHYTTSLDAALTLVPDHPLSPWASLRFDRRKDGCGCFLDRDDTFAATPALALCIAALRARLK